jgi:hypothetical protein
MAIGLIILPDIDNLHRLAAWGIVLGVFGAGVLYWETAATDPNLQSVSYEIARAGSSTKFSVGESAWVTALCHAGFVMFFCGQV